MQLVLDKKKIELVGVLVACCTLQYVEYSYTDGLDRHRNQNVPEPNWSIDKEDSPVHRWVRVFSSGFDCSPAHVWVCRS